MREKSFPIFFSVSSNDIGFAEEVWRNLPDDWVYIYSKTGEHAADMWQEISEVELPKSKIMVVFWSNNYIYSQGCVREIKQACDLIDQKIIRPIVLRLDNCPIFWNKDYPEDTKSVFESLKSALAFRTSDENVSVAHSVELVTRLVDGLLVQDHPRLPRPDIMQSLRASLQLPNDRFKFYPAAWLSGFNGVGRETVIREYNRSFYPNGRGVTIDINEATLPRQLLLRIESQALGAGTQRLENIQQAVFDDELQQIADAIERVDGAGNYVILRHGRIVDERIELPEWLDGVVNALRPSTRTKLFIVSQVPLPVERRIRCRGQLEAKRVPTIDEYSLREYCYQLIAHFDRQTERWTEDVVERVVSAACGNVGFLVSLVRAVSSINDLDQLEQLIAAEDSPMAEQMSVYIRWAFHQLSAFADEQRTLIFLNDVSPCDILDLERAVKPSRPMVRVLGKLLEYGLVERESAGLYRLTPLLANRLSTSLIKPDLLDWFKKAIAEFISSPPTLETPDHEFLRIETRIQAALMTGSGHVPENIARFVSAAHWFQAGIRLYHANRRELAYRLLKKAFKQRSKFAQATRVEIIRYFCLSATRKGDYKSSEECIKLLDGDHRTKALAAFLKGNVQEYKRNYIPAIKHYEDALRLNKGKDSRLEHTYRPLIKCIIRTDRPNFTKAEGYAIEYVGLRKTIFSLMALARVYLNWIYRSSSTDEGTPPDLEGLYERAFQDLEAYPGAVSATFEIRSEEALFQKDFEGAIVYMDKAVAADPRASLKNDRWRLISMYGDTSAALQTLRELDEIKAQPEFASDWAPYMLSLAETYFRALKTAGRPAGLLNQFASSLSEEEIRSVIFGGRNKYSSMA